MKANPTVTAVSPIVRTHFLLGGDNLTVTGTLFAMGANVSVGDTDCTNVTFVSVTSLSCFAPAKPAGNYSVVVTNPDTGYSNATTVMVTYTAYNGGNNLTITGTLFVDGANVSVGGTACTNVTFVNATSLSCLAPAKPAGNYSVVVTNPDTGYSDATTVVVSYQP
eukprot:gene22659-29809_t